MSKYGYIRDTADDRDHVYTGEAVEVPAKVSLRDSPFMPSVYDQLRIGTCVPNSSGALFEYVLRKLGLIDFMPSRLFIYALGRQLEGSPLDQDTGMMPRDALKVLAKNGVCPEPDWPYSDANPGPFQQFPDTVAISKAQASKAIEYKQIVVGSPGRPLRACLAAGYPFIFGFDVSAKLESQAMADGTDVLLPLPNDTDNPLTNEGHGVMAIGYDFTRQRFPVPVFEIRNSWSAQWGDEGHFFMDYRYFDRYASDLWTLRTVS